MDISEEEFEKIAENTPRRLQHLPVLCCEVRMPYRSFGERIYVSGTLREDACLTFYDPHTCAEDELDMQEEHTYRVELIDTWEMIRTLLAEQADGKIQLPAKEGMAVLATRITEETVK